MVCLSAAAVAVRLWLVVMCLLVVILHVELLFRWDKNPAGTKEKVQEHCFRNVLHNTEVVLVRYLPLFINQVMKKYPFEKYNVEIKITPALKGQKKVSRHRAAVAPKEGIPLCPATLKQYTSNISKAFQCHHACCLVLVHTLSICCWCLLRVLLGS